MEVMENVRNRQGSMQHIRRHIKEYYGRLYGAHTSPSIGMPIRQGRDLAAFLKYPVQLLDDLPQHAWDHFLPCGNPLLHLRPTPGERILNLGSGIGIDSLTMVRSFQYPLQVVNLDIVAGILAKSRQLASRPGPGYLENTESCMSWVCGEGDDLPFARSSFDWVVMNGAFNLFPSKLRVLDQIRHTLKPQGRLLVTDLGATEALPPYFREELDGWAWCMSGACVQSETAEMLKSTGFALISYSEDEVPDHNDILFRITFTAQCVD
jgi:SAM-dependent methyltransferase